MGDSRLTKALHLIPDDVQLVEAVMEGDLIRAAIGRTWRSDNGVDLAVSVLV